jgi:membrane protein YdbS with pleckstrin-like domain
MRNEAVLADVNPSWTSYTWLLAFAALLLLAGIVETAVGDDAAAGAAITGIVLCSVFVGYAYWKRSKTHYVVTDQRVVKRTGLLRTNVQEAAYGAISAVNTEQGTLQSLFGDGTVRIGTTTGAGAIELRGVPSHHELATLVRQRHPTLSSRGQPGGRGAPPGQGASPQQRQRGPRARSAEQSQQQPGPAQQQPPRQQSQPGQQDPAPHQQERAPGRDGGGQRDRRRAGQQPADGQPSGEPAADQQPTAQSPGDEPPAGRGPAAEERAAEEPAQGASTPDRGDLRAGDDDGGREDVPEEGVEPSVGVEETDAANGERDGDEDDDVNEDEDGGEDEGGDGDAWRVD